ncbi:replication protein RepA [Mesorhizobium sp. M0478]|uniref:replication protein RepA n=1 Tax=Mesorhizobium sp. M0478 TaxID=2956947 RepID=UPI00333A4A3D
MNRPDESLIRDEDLLAELEAARGNSLFLAIANTIISRQQRRDQERAADAMKAQALAALPRERRRRAVIREVFENSPPSLADVRHIHSVLAVVGLPHERQAAGVREYVRTQGNMGIIVQAGTTLDETGRAVHHQLPFGPKARLVLMHLCSEAIRQKSATVEIADTFTGFVRDMGFSDSGGRKGPLTAFREQLNALATCSMRISAFAPGSLKTKQFFPIEDMEVWLSSDPNQRSLWPSTVTFSPTMFESLSKHALPVNAKVVKAFAGSSRKLDLYFWLGWRIHNIDQPLHLSWEAVTQQFGDGFARPRAFRAKFAEEVSHLKEVLPKLPLKLTERGLTLSPADPDALALPAQRTLIRR